MNLKDHDFDLDFSFPDNLEKEEKEKFISLIQESNTRENTVEIQCAIWMKIIQVVMHKYIDFQKLLNNILADLIIAFEKMNVKITVSKNED
jgi:hypothetical protein